MTGRAGTPRSGRAEVNHVQKLLPVGPGQRLRDIRPSCHHRDLVAHGRRVYTIGHAFQLLSQTGRFRDFIGRISCQDAAECAALGKYLKCLVMYKKNGMPFETSLMCLIECVWTYVRMWTRVPLSCWNARAYTCTYVHT